MADLADYSINAHKANDGSIYVTVSHSDDHWRLTVRCVMAYSPDKAAAGGDWAKLLRGEDPVADGWESAVTGDKARELYEWIEDNCEWIGSRYWLSECPAGIDSDGFGTSGRAFLNAALAAMRQDWYTVTVEDNAGFVHIASVRVDDELNEHVRWMITYTADLAALAGHDWAAILGGADPIGEQWDGVEVGEAATDLYRYMVDADPGCYDWIANSLWPVDDYPAHIDKIGLGDSGQEFRAAALAAL